MSAKTSKLNFEILQVLFRRKWLKIKLLIISGV